MDIRNVQKTGNMHYLYLPTSWCKKYKVTSDTKISLVTNNDGSISIFPEIKETEKKHININLPESDPQSLIKLIMACYINPVKSFNIKLEKEANLSKILDKKKSVSALEFVELDGNSITHESSIFIKDPHSLLKTMVKKIKNLVNVMIDHYDKDIINKYEEEIDRSKLLITKAVTESLVLNEPTKLKPSDLFYIAMLNLDLERMVDSLILVDAKEDVFLKKLLNILDNLRVLLEKSEKLSYIDAVGFDKMVSGLKAPEVENLKTYGLRRIKKHLINISEVLFDWAISIEIEKNT